MPGIGIISNPHSKLNRKNPQRHEYLTYIAGEEGHVAVTQTLEDLAKVAEDFREHGIKILAINGGDGTISQTLTAFIKTYGSATLPKIVLLRGGTINVLAENLGIKGSPEQVLYRLIEKHSINKLETTRRVSTLVAGGQHGFLFGNGTAANFLELFYQNKTGPLGSLLLFVRLMISRLSKKTLYDSVAKSVDTAVIVDSDKKPSHQSISTLIATIPRMPLGFKLFPKTTENSQLAQLVSYTGDARKDIFKAVFDFFVRPSKSTDAKISYCGKSFSVECGEPTPYTLDGELFYPEGNVVDVQIGTELEFIIV
ncbi:diacylglycerol kinase family protein [bacterium]|nr:diacylglycerol kinase family protein [bacterium]